MTISDSTEFFRQSAKNLLDLAVSICGTRFGVIHVAGEAVILTDPGAPLPLFDALRAFEPSSEDLFTVIDDERLRSHITGIRFFCSVGLLDAAGERRGTLALLDDRSRSLTELQKTALLKITAEVMRGLDRAAAIREAHHTRIRFRALADGAPVAVFAYRVGTSNFSYVNAQFAERLGYTVDEVLAFEEFTDVIAADQQAVMAEIMRRRRDGDRGHFRYETKVRCRDGTLREAEIHSGIIEADGEQLVIGAAVDNTEQKRAERQLAQLDRLTSLGRLAAQVAHEFNNVMMGIQPLAETIRRRVAGDHALMKFIDVIMASLQRGKRLTTDILRFARPAQLVLASVDVRSLLNDTAEEVRPLLGTTINLDVSCPEGLFLHGDSTQLTQVLVNLALNARDSMEATAGGRLSISAETAAAGEIHDDRHFVHICVRDSGGGIAAQDLPYIFEPLFTTKNRGTGLGLSVAFQVVAAHDGHILAESEPGAGAAFHLFIPAASAEPEKKPQLIEMAPEVAEPVHVLIVEDDEAVATGLRWFLEGEGMKVRVAATGGQVLNFIAEQKPDVIVLDLSLPDEGGRSVYDRVAARYSIPVIFSSGQASERDVEDILKNPRTAFFMKPYPTEDLVKAIRRMTRET